MFVQSNYKMDNVYSAVNSVIQSVDQDNVFILSTGSNLSLLENKLINFLLSCIRMDDESFRTMLVTYDAIYRIFDYDTGKRGRIDRIDKLVTGLKDKTIHITPYPGCPYAAGEFPWFEICEKVEDETWDGDSLPAESEEELYKVQLLSDPVFYQQVFCQALHDPLHREARLCC